MLIQHVQIKILYEIHAKIVAYIRVSSNVRQTLSGYSL